MSTDCVFCKIAAGELPARILYADETVCVSIVRRRRPAMRWSHHGRTAVTSGRSKTTS